MQSSDGRDRDNKGAGLGGFDPEKPRRLIVDSKELDELIYLNGVTSSPVVGGGPKLRRSSRFPMDGKRASAKVFHPGGGVTYWEVLMLDISETGAALMYPGFLHIGTRVNVLLPRVRGGDLAALGEVVRCRFIKRIFHAVGVEWERPIDPRDFVSSALWIESLSYSHSGASALIAGHALHLCWVDVEHQLLKMQLLGTSMTVDQARDTGSLFDFVRKSPVDILIIDIESAGESPTRLLADLRSEQLMGPVLMIAPSALADLDELRQDENVEIIAKPVTQDSLLTAIRTLMQRRTDPVGGTSPIYSNLDHDTERRGWVASYIESCYSIGDKLLHASQSDDTVLALELCHTLAVTGAGYGFPVLSDAAAKAVKSLHANASAHECGAEIRALTFLINRLRATQESAEH